MSGADPKPVALLPFDFDRTLDKVSRVRRWQHAELGLVQEATCREVADYANGQGVHVLFRLPLPNPEGQAIQEVWARTVKPWED